MNTAIPPSVWENVFRDGFLSGQTALITGGGTGIGRELTLAMVGYGANAVICGRRAEPLAAVAAECDGLTQAGKGRCVPVAADIRDPAQIEEAIGAALRLNGRLDILINNAGANFLCPAAGISPKGFHTIVEIILQGTFNVTLAAGRIMLEQRQGCIIMNAGTNAQAGSPLMLPSGVGKAGMISMAQTLAAEWGPFGIRVNAISPGPVDTQGATSRLWSNRSHFDRVARAVPLGARLAVPRDIIGTFLFLVSGAASFITGANLEVDGGNRLRQMPLWEEGS